MGSNLAEKLDPFSWLPAPELRPFEFWPGELEILRKKEPLTVSQYAEKYRIVSVSSIPGPWRNKNAPYLVEIMDTWGKESTRGVIVCAGSQLGKTEALYNCFAYAADYDPGPTLFVMPDKVTGARVVNDRIIPMIDDSPRLRLLKSKNPDDTSNTRIKFKNGMFAYLAWSNSEAALASTPIKYLNLDEVDKYPAGAVQNAKARVRTYVYEKKVFEISTPTFETGAIWVDLNNEADEIRDFYIPCPCCGHLQVFDFDRIIYPADTTAARIKSGKLARYSCENGDCDYFFDDMARDQAVQMGQWIARIPAKDPQIIGFHLPAFYSKFVSISEIAAAYLDAQLDPDKLAYFYNDCLALPIPEDANAETASDKALYDRREDYAPEGETWQVPAAACLLTAGVDVQDDRLECEVVAWGPGKETWGIETRVFSGSPGGAQVWADLDDYLEGRFEHETGVRLGITAVGFDTGGHHTDEAYKFIKPRQARRFYATKGASTPGKPIISKPSTKNKGKVRLYSIGTETAKDSLFSWMNFEKPGPRFMHFPRSYGFEFFRQLTSEKAVQKKDGRGRLSRVWVKKKGYQRNEALDIRCLNLAAFEILNPNMDKLSRSLADQARDYRKPSPLEQVVETLKKITEAVAPGAVQEPKTPKSRKRRIIKRAR